MMEHSERGDPIDVVTLSDSLKAKNELDAVGGASYLASCQDSVPTAVNVAHYARIVKRSFQSRELVRLFTECTRAAYVDDRLVVTSEIISQLLRINPAHSNVIWPIEKLVTECLKDLEQAYDSNGRIVGVPTGLNEFENHYGGISRERSRRGRRSDDSWKNLLRRYDRKEYGRARLSRRFRKRGERPEKNSDAASLSDISD